LLTIFFYAFVPLLIIYYLNNRYCLKLKWSFNVIVALVFFNLSDIIQSGNLFGENLKLQFIQIFMVFISQIFYLLEFRNEGAFLVDNIKLNPIKLIVSAVVVFVVSGFIFLNVEETYFYFLLMITSFELFILIVFSFFRPINRYSYNAGVFGVSLMFIAEALFTFSYFIYKSIPIHVTSMIMYFVSQVFIVESFVHSKRKINI
jgi:hypothetical protein